MTRDEIYAKVRDIVVEALSVDEDEVKPSATLFGDLGAESIDLLDIGFQLEQAFGFKIQQGEMFPEGVASDPQFVQGGKLTPTGIATLREKAPHLDLAALEADPKIERVRDIFTVNAMVAFVQRKLG